MADAYSECLCSRLPDGTGGSPPVAWLAMHERVALTTVDGHRVEGRPGIAWSEEAGRFDLGIKPDEGLVVAPTLSKVQSAMPIVAPDPLRVVESVARYLRQPAAIPNGRIWMSAMADEHQYVSVAVALLRQPCMTLRT